MVSIALIAVIVLTVLFIFIIHFLLVINSFSLVLLHFSIVAFITLPLSKTVLNQKVRKVTDDRMKAGLLSPI